MFILVDGAASSSLSAIGRAGTGHDRLTELPNGITLDKQIAELRKAPVSGLAVYYIDLDGFKAINDEHEHNVANSSGR